MKLGKNDDHQDSTNSNSEERIPFEVKLSSGGLSKIDSEIILKSLTKSGSLVHEQQVKVLSDETVKTGLEALGMDEKKGQIWQAALAQVRLDQGKKLSQGQQGLPRNRYEEHELEH